MKSSTMKMFLPVLAALWAWASCGWAQANNPPDLAGVYQSIPNGTALPGALKNSGSPNEISLLPKAAAQAKTISLNTDPARTCQPLGPFRMMARDGATVEFAPATGMMVMLFEDYLHGVMRIIYMNRGHKENVVDGPEPGMEPGPTWLGDSIGRWEGESLVVDTVGFNTRTWLNDAGAQHTEALHLIERIRPVLNGQYLEYRMTLEDSGALAKPYTYTRYFKKLAREIEDDICVDQQ